MKTLLIITLVTFSLNQAKAQNRSEVQKIVASDRATYDIFGNAVSISGDYVIVGSKNSEDATGGNTMANAGSAYMFERDTSGNWNQGQKIVASDRAAIDQFGLSVSISGDYAIVGAYTEDEDATGGNTMISSGSAYLFERDGSGNWNQVQKVVASDRAAGDCFGLAVGISGNYAIVGAPSEDHDTAGGSYRNEAGSVYFFGPIETGILEKDPGLSLSIYPNPSRERFTINLNGSYSDIGVSVSNLLGKTISSQHFEYTQQLSIEIKGPAGLYLLEIKTGEGRVARVKVVKR